MSAGIWLLGALGQNPALAPCNVPCQPLGSVLSAAGQVSDLFQSVLIPNTTHMGNKWGLDHRKGQ